MESATSDTAHVVQSSNSFISSNNNSSITQSYMTSGYSTTKENTTFSEFKASTNTRKFTTSVFSSNNANSNNNEKSKPSSFSSALLRTTSSTKKNSITSEFKGSTSITTGKSSIFVSNTVISSNAIRSITPSSSSVLPSLTLSYWSNSNIRSSIKPSTSVETQAASSFITTITSVWTSASKHSSNMQSKETSRYLPMSSYLHSSMITKKNSSNSMFRGSTSTDSKIISSYTASRRMSSFSSALARLTSSYWSNANTTNSAKSSVSVVTHSTSSFFTTIASHQATLSKYSSYIRSEEISRHWPVSSMITKESSTTFVIKASSSIRNRKTSVILSKIVISSNVVINKTSSFSSVLPSFTLSYWSNANIRSSIKPSASVKTQATSSFITTITSLSTAVLKHSSNMRSKETSRQSPMSSYFQSSMITKENSTNSMFRGSTSTDSKIISSYTASRRMSSFSSALARLTSSYWSNANTTNSAKSSVSVVTHSTSSFFTTIASHQATLSKYSSYIRSEEISRHWPVSSMITKESSTTFVIKASSSIRNRKTSVILSKIVISSNVVINKTSSFSSVLPSFTLSYWSNANIRSSIKPSASVKTQATSSFITTITSLSTAVLKHSSNMRSKETSRKSPMSSYLKSSMITKENSTNSVVRRSTSIGNLKATVFPSKKIISSYTARRRTSSFSSALPRLTSYYWSNANIVRSIKSSASVITYATPAVIRTITSLQAPLLKYSSNMHSSESKNIISSNSTSSKTSSSFSVSPLFTSSYWSNGNIRSNIKSSASVGASGTTSSLFGFSSMTIFTSFALTESKYSSIMQRKETSKYSPFTSYLRSSLIMIKSTTSFERRRSESIRNFKTSVLASNNLTASNTRTRKPLSLSSVSQSLTSNSKSFTNIKSSIKQFGSVVTHTYATFITTGTLISTTKSKYYMQSKETVIYPPMTAYLHTSKQKKEKTTVPESKESKTIWNFKTTKLASNNLIPINTASSRVKDNSIIKFTYKMQYVSSTIPKNLTAKIKSSLNSVTRRSGESMLMASNQTILKTISHSTSQLINNGTSYYDTSLLHIGTPSLSLKKFTSITTTGHAKHHSRSLETAKIGKNFSILSKHSFLNLFSVTSIIKSIFQTSILDKMSYATIKLETSIYSSVSLLKTSSQKSSVTILPSASKHKSETFSTHFGLKKTLTSEIFTTSSSYNSALSSLGKTNTPLLETASTDSIYQKSLIGLRKSSSNLFSSITNENHFSTDKILYSSSRFSSQSDHYSNHSLIRTSFDFKPFKPAKENEIKFKAKIKLISETFTEHLKNKSSGIFKQLEKAVREALTSLYQKLKGFVEVVNISFEAGSVITNYEIIIDKEESEAKNAKSIEYSIINITRNKLNTGSLGIFNVSSSFDITLSESASPKKKVKFPGWAIGLIVIVILVIIAFIVVATQKVSCFLIKILFAVSTMFNCSLGQNHFCQALKSSIILNYLENLFDKSNS